MTIINSGSRGFEIYCLFLKGCPNMSQPVRVFLVIFLLCLSVQVKAQTRDVNIDSLKKLVEVTVHDTVSINNLLYLSYLQTFLYPDDAIEYALIVRREAPKIPFEEAYLKSFYMVAKVYNGLGLPEKAIEELQFLMAQEGLTKFPEVQCDCHKALGHAYRDIYQTDLAIEHYHKSIEIGKRIGDFGCHGGCLISLGNLYDEVNNIELARQYYKESLSSLEGTTRHHIVASVYFSLANIDSLYHDRISMIDSAIYYSQLVRDTSNIINSKWRRAQIHNSHSHNVLAKKDFEECIDLIENYFEELSLQENAELARFYMEINQRNKARQHYLDATKIRDSGDKFFIGGGYYRNLSDYHELNGSYKEALENHKIYLQYIDSLNNKKMVAAISEANSKYQTEKKETEIARQQLVIEKEQHTRSLLMGGTATGLTLLATLFFGFYQRTKHKRNETELALRLEQERADDLENVSNIKTDFFNNVSHELRTPLTLIMAPLEDAYGKIRHKEIKEDIGLALRNSKRLLNLTNEILDLSKIEAAKLELEYSSIELNSFLKRIYRAFDSLAKTRNIELRDNISNVPAYAIKTDPAKLEKILNNLISNALKYSDDNSVVHFNIDVEALSKDRLIISIKDQGSGILKEEQAKIFDRFYQSTNASHASGTGIGLALVKKLVDLFDGTITLLSKPGHGSRFTVNFPVTAGTINPISRVEPQSIKKENFPVQLFINGDKPRILIVEDDIEMSKYLVSLLTKEYNCDTAYNGTQALNKIKNGNYDLISSDVMMPEMDGFELRENIISLGRTHIPFIMLTARVLEEDKIRGLRMGVDDYITKPFSSAEFKARTYNLIANRINREAASIEAPDDRSYEEEIVSRATQVVLKNIDNSGFNVENLAEDLNYSTRQLGRILQKETGLTAVKFILEIRLQKAFDLIKNGKFSTINEVRYEIGIESASYFSSKFKERFGISPGESGNGFS